MTRSVIWIVGIIGGVVAGVLIFLVLPESCMKINEIFLNDLIEASLDKITES